MAFQGRGTSPVEGHFFKHLGALGLPCQLADKELFKKLSRLGSLVVRRQVRRQADRLRGFLSVANRATVNVG